MINYGQGIVGYVLNVISLIHSSIACVISPMVIAIIIYHQYHNRLKREEKITLVLSANIYLIIFIFTLQLISFNIQTLIGDVYGNNFDSSSCIFRGYFLTVMCSALYHAFVVEAFFRLCRIVYSNNRRLQFFWLYVIIIPVQLVVASILVCPILIWHDVIYLSNEHYCFIPFTQTHGFLWILLTAYGLPLLYLLLIYIRIILFIRQHSNTVILAVKRRQQRDLLAIQRIFINVGLLTTIGIPALVLLIMCFITGQENPFSYRILMIGLEVSMAVLSIEMIFMTPQLKKIVMRRWQQNQVAAIAIDIQMRPIRSTQ